MRLLLVNYHPYTGIYIEPQMFLKVYYFKKKHNICSRFLELHKEKRKHIFIRNHVHLALVFQIFILTSYLVIYSIYNVFCCCWLFSNNIKGSKKKEYWPSNAKKIFIQNSQKRLSRQMHAKKKIHSKT